MEGNHHNHKNHNKSEGQRQNLINKDSLNLMDKKNGTNNISKAEKTDYKFYLKKYNRSLYDLFCSELFTIELLLDYLIHKEDPNIIDFLVDLLYNRFQNNILYNVFIKFNLFCSSISVLALFKSSANYLVYMIRISNLLILRI